MTNANEPISAIVIENAMSGPDINYGLTKREYFAAMAMQGMIAKYGTDYQSSHAKESVYMADELMEALNAAK